MTLFNAILERLKANSTFVGYLGKDIIDPNDDSLISSGGSWIVGDDVKVFPNVGSQLGSYPQVVINHRFLPIYCHEDSKVNYRDCDVQIDVYYGDYENINQKGYEGVNLVTEEVINSLDGWSSVSDKIKLSTLQNVSYDYDPEERLYRSILEFKMVTYAS